MAADIFISYRGADRVVARKLENRLRSRWGSRVFRDETGVTSGRNWMEELNTALDEASVIIALVGPGWNITSDLSVEDWVRKELKHAVNEGTPILAVLVGESEELRPKLSSLPEAFQRQAVVVGPELAGFDIHRIASAVGRLGALRVKDGWTIAARRDEMVPETALGRASNAIKDGKNVLVVGSSGSGRNALLQQLVAQLEAENHLVGSYGIQDGIGLRHTHAVISGWIHSLCDIFQNLNSPYSDDQVKYALVKAVLKAGPDLLSRRIVRANALLPIGGTEDDKLILKAVRRSTVRWAPFPPTRLRNQSRQVLETMLECLKPNGDKATSDGVPTSILNGKKHKLVLVVDHYDSVDSVSRELVQSLIERPIEDGPQFVLASYKHVEWANDKLLEPVIIEAEDSWGEKLQIQPWLDAHHVELAEPVARYLQLEPNPYRALAKLWYLVDNGLVDEPPHVPTPKDLTTDDEQKQRSSLPGEAELKRKAAENAKVCWSAVGDGKKLLEEYRTGESDDPIPEEVLLDHMIEEYVPVGFRKFVEAGALMGRAFSFHAAYAAVEPLDEKPSSRERDRWLKKAECFWNDLSTIDPDKSVLSCTKSVSGELMVSLAQASFIGHLQKRLDPQTASEYHQRLARYLVNPVEKLHRENAGDEYHRVNLAAEHWSAAQRTREAADAHRDAAVLAEKSLSYGESKRHYEDAIRLYTQLLAENPDPKREHEDLLILANCYYRVGQTKRLSGNPHKAIASINDAQEQPWGAINYLERALEWLDDLEALLLDNKQERWPDGITGPCARGIPGPNLVRHHMRVCNAVKGHVHLELAQCREYLVNDCRSKAGDELHTCPKCEDDHRAIRDRLFDSLRHAEAAQGEAGSRWLLAAASAGLAALLADESVRTQYQNKQRSSLLAIEAFFHIERIICLEPYTSDEKQEFSDPVSVAWRTVGRLFRHRALEPRIAEWCFRKMNAHGDDVTTTVDMTTDRWLGGFLLSICEPGESPQIINEARDLLIRHRDWAIESGIINVHAPAHLRLYLLELIASQQVEGEEREILSRARKKHLADAWKACRVYEDELRKNGAEQAVAERQNRDCSLFAALEEIIHPSPKSDGNDLIEELRKAITTDQREQLGEDEITRAGEAKMAMMLLRRVPLMHKLVEDFLNQHHQRSGEELISEQDAEYARWQNRAETYQKNLRGGQILSPCVDNEHERYIRRLAEWRLPKDAVHRADEIKNQAHTLMERYRESCESEEHEDIDVLLRDVEFAAYIHDWYGETDPARLLTLASEWNLKISGEEWSNPRLMRGRLAISVLKKMYDAESVLGKDRFDRITKMVENSVVGHEQRDSALGKVFYLAKAQVDNVIDSIDKNADLDSEYDRAIKRKKKGVWNLGYVAPASEDSESITMPALPDSGATDEI